MKYSLKIILKTNFINSSLNLMIEVLKYVYMTNL